MVNWKDDKNINKLKELVERGLSAGHIGDIFGCTKNAIIGKCSRLGFMLAGSRCLHANRRPRRHLVTKPKRLKKRLFLKPTTEEPTIKVKARKFLKVKSKMSDTDKTMGMLEFYKRLGIPPIPDDNSCHHITGDDIKNGNHTWCNGLTHDGSLYCEYHYNKVYASNYRVKPQNYVAPRSRFIR